MDFDGKSPITKEGTAASGWILLDYGRVNHTHPNLVKYSIIRTSGSVIVHVMTPQMRNFYKIEKRWKDAEVSIRSIDTRIFLSLLLH